MRPSPPLRGCAPCACVWIPSGHQDVRELAPHGSLVVQTNDLSCLLLSSLFSLGELAGDGSLFVSESSLTTESDLPFAGEVYRVREKPHHAKRH